MKKINAEVGGRPFANDDLVTLQNELADAVQAQFLGKGPFILSGCIVGGTGPTYNVAAGIVCLDGQLLRFVGAGAVTLPMQLQAGTAVATDPRPYQTGGTKYCMREVPAVLVATDPAYVGGEFLLLDTWGGKRWDDVQRASIRSLGEVQQLASVSLGNYDATGLGKAGTEAWGWGLCDGQNNRADLRGQFVTGLDPARADYDTIGKTGGVVEVALTAPQNGPHYHPFSSADRPARKVDTVTYSGGSSGVNAVVDHGEITQTGTAGSGQPHENRPPFYVLAAREWVGIN